MQHRGCICPYLSNKIRMLECLKVRLDPYRLLHGCLRLVLRRSVHTLSLVLGDSHSASTNMRNYTTSTSAARVIWRSMRILSRHQVCNYRGEARHEVACLVLNRLASKILRCACRSVGRAKGACHGLFDTSVCGVDH